MPAFSPERRPLPESEPTGTEAEAKAKLTGQAGEVEAADKGESTADASGPILDAQAVIVQMSARLQKVTH